jgi:hypothetical protein
MGIEQLKHWHWIVIGMIVGVVLAYARFSHTGGQDFEPRAGLEAARFEELAESFGEAEHPPLLNLVVHPPIEGKNYVTGQYLRRVRRGEPEYWRFELNAAIPFAPSGSRSPAGEHFTIRDYLDEQAAAHPELSYRYAWWNRPALAAAMWGLGAVVVIGGLWPIMLNLLIGAGFARQPEPKEPEYDLERFRPEPEPAKKPAPTATEDDMARLEAMEQELERKLSADGGSPSAEASQAHQHPQAPIKPLSGGPLQSQPGPNEPEEPKEYQGEFYPVVRPGRPPQETP